MHSKNNHEENIKCKVCNESFDKNSDMELHMTTVHETEKKNRCDIYEKTFMFEWRLRKHKFMHQSVTGTKCHYYNNSKDCPYEEVGCKFKHIPTPQFKFGKTCGRRLCQFKHSCSKELLKETNNDHTANDEPALPDGEINEKKFDEKSMVVNEDVIKCAHYVYNL